MVYEYFAADDDDGGSAARHIAELQPSGGEAKPTTL